MAVERERPLERWSRLKRAGAASDRTEAEPPPPTTTESKAAPAVEPVADLPNIDSLGKDSDFTVFVREGVPEETHRQALRKLWQSDPALTAHDGLTDYAEDYSRTGIVATLVRTAYQVGKGYLEASPAEEKKEEKEDEKKGEREVAAGDAAEVEEAHTAADIRQGEPSPEAHPVAPTGNPDQSPDKT
jgi:hypothetical protein